jgi:hypothetical protein
MTFLDTCEQCGEQVPDVDLTRCVKCGDSVCPNCQGAPMSELCMWCEDSER